MLISDERILKLLEDVASMKTSVENIEKKIEKMENDKTVSELKEKNEKAVNELKEEVEKLKNFRTQVLTYASIGAFIAAFIASIIVNKI